MRFTIVDETHKDSKNYPISACRKQCTKKFVIFLNNSLKKIPRVYNVLKEMFIVNVKTVATSQHSITCLPLYDCMGVEHVKEKFTTERAHSTQIEIHHTDSMRLAFTFCDNKQEE